jgi:hypothetical protein
MSNTEYDLVQPAHVIPKRILSKVYYYGISFGMIK